MKRTAQNIVVSAIDFVKRNDEKQRGDSMNIFEQLIRDIIIAGTYTAPVFIHSQHGIAILNASEEALAAILQAQAQPKPAAPPAQ